MNRHSYNPVGVCKNPIPVRLMADERSEADDIARQAGVSRAKVLRDAIVAGLPLVRTTLLSTSAAQPTPSRAADFSGGVASAFPAGLSTPAA